MDELLAQGARVGTAGFVLSRLLLEPPSQALAESFASPQMRETWPLRDAHSLHAVESVSAEPLDALARDHATMFRRRPPLVPLHESAWRPSGTDRDALREELLTTYAGTTFAGLPTPVDDHLGYQLAYLAELATRVGRCHAAGDVAGALDAAEAATRLRAEHTDHVVGPVVESIARHARTRLYRAVPGLLRGFLSGHTALCATVLQGVS
ncbi:molecular chaperone TorD family protein [Georgenia phoenicis]|uniref:TorD/DmsD family molecular chaperone n=1 Tax=unclassified Georgenia TaxID=2626815 RepID=UPI0039AF6DBF